MLKDKEVIRAVDIVAELGVSKATAYKIIREIKSISDKLGISGMVHQGRLSGLFKPTKKWGGSKWLNLRSIKLQTIWLSYQIC